MAVDMRGFRYPLDPIRTRLRWELDSLRERFRQARETAEVAASQLDALNEEMTGISCEPDKRFVKRFDPRQHEIHIGYFSDLRRRIEKQSLNVSALFQRCEEIRDDCARKEREQEAVEAHRARCLEQFRELEQAKQHAENDRDWITRSWRHAARPCGVPGVGEKESRA